LKYRRKIEIVADILNVAKNRARKTQIMYKGNLSYKLLNKYLKMLIEANLIESENDSNYIITLNGGKFLEIFKSTNSDMDELANRLVFSENTDRCLKGCVLTLIYTRMII